jgi:hypothetical protein
VTRILTDGEGPGSLLEIERYIAAVIRERTDMKPDTREVPATTPEKLARNMRISILHRLGYLDYHQWSPAHDDDCEECAARALLDREPT